MDRPDPRAGQHGVGSFRDHGEIDCDRIALLHAVIFKHIRKAADLIVQLSVSDLPRFARIVALPDDRHLVGTRSEVPVDAVRRHIRDAVLEPFDRNLAGIETGILHLGEGFDPVYSLAMMSPELFRRRRRKLIHFFVLRRIDVSAFSPLRRHVIDHWV
jgi:hypothetical protein